MKSKNITSKVIVVLLLILASVLLLLGSFMFYLGYIQKGNTVNVFGRSIYKVESRIDEFDLDANSLVIIKGEAQFETLADINNREDITVIKNAGLLLDEKNYTYLTCFFIVVFGAFCFGLMYETKKAVAEKIKKEIRTDMTFPEEEI